MQVEKRFTKCRSAGLRQLSTLGRAHRPTDAFYLYHYLLDHPACAEASQPDGATLLAGCELLLEEM